MTIRILIADDHGVLRAGLRALLNAESDLKVVAEAADGPETLRLAAELCPDVVLLDLTMPGPGGIEVARQLHDQLPDSRILILTLHEDEGLLQEAIRAGASGYIIKRAVEAELINAIQAVWRGDLYIHPAMTRSLLKEQLPSPASQETLADLLTPRELDILRLIARGHTNNHIAEVLSIGVRTVESHRSNLMAKLGMHNRVELVRYAIEHDLLD